MPSPVDETLSAPPGPARRRDHLAAEPRRRIAVVTCMDARLDPLRDLGLDLGDAHVIRNAGGRVTDDVLRSLLLSWHTLGTREVVVVHHSRCGVEAADEGTLRSRLAERTGASLDGVDLHTFSDPVAALRADVTRIRDCAFPPGGLVVRGAIHDLDAGVVEEVDSDGQP